MSAEKGKLAGDQKQLSLPFGNPTESRPAADEQQHKANLISFQQRLKSKNVDTQDDHRKRVIQKLLDHANSLDW